MALVISMTIFSKFMADSIAKQAVKVPVKIERNRNN